MIFNKFQYFYVPTINQGNLVGLFDLFLLNNLIFYFIFIHHE